MKNYILLFLFYFLFVANAQQIRPPVINFTPNDYGTLQTPENICVFEDKRGFILVGNSGGVLVYNGNDWSFIKVMPGHMVTAINQNKKGEIFVGTHFGEFGKLVPDINGSMKFVSLAEKFTSNNLNIGRVASILCLNNKIYITNGANLIDNLFIYENEKVSVVKTKTSFHLIFKCNDKIYARERGVGLVTIEGNKSIPVCKIPEFSDYGIFGVLPMNKKKILIITQEKGLWTVDGNVPTCLSADSAELKSHKIYGAIRLNNGYFALNTLVNGVLIVNQIGKIVAVLDKTSGLKVNDIKNIIQDKQDNLWLATSNGVGLVNYGSYLHYFNDNSGLSGSPTCALRLKNKMYVGTKEGFFQEQPSCGKQFSVVPNLQVHIWDLAHNGKQIFVSSDDGIFYGDENGFKLLSSIRTNTLFIDEKTNVLYASSVDGIYWFDIVSKKQIGELYFDEPLTQCLSLKVDPSSSAGRTILWMGTLGQGVVECNIEQNNASYKIHNNLDQNSLSFTSPAILNNKIYFCTAGGLRKMIIQDGKPFFDFSGLSDELDNTRLSYAFQSGNRIYICAENEIFYIDKKGNIIKTPFLPIDMGQVLGLYSENEKSCWVPAANGLVRYHETGIKKYDADFNVVFSKILIGKDSVLFNGNWSSNTVFVNSQPIGAEYNFDFKYNSIEFFVSALYFESQSKITYSHYLEGADNMWSSWSTDRNIKFSNLHEGNYSLKIKAKNVYGKESAVISFTFSILPPWYRTTVAYVMYGLAIIIIFYVTNRLLSARLKKKNEQLEDLVKKRTVEIEKKNDELHEQNIQISHQKQEITDSINYAQKIQEAMLPFSNEFKAVLPESFVLFKPKDIVSGDFYWTGMVDEFLIIICADCTGHGVPGAFMSMLCIDKLNHIISEKKIVSPNKILEEANKGIKRSLGQADEQNLRTKDGMDASVILYDTKLKKLFYAGANRPLWKVRGAEITEYRPDKCAVGGFTVEEQTFTLNEIDFEKGDCFYTSTDGYADQFGGPKGKKIMVKNFKDYLLKIISNSFDEQKNNLDDFVEAWKNPTDTKESYEQVDDICVIGFKI